MAAVLGDILGVGKDFIPHIELVATKWIARNYVMPSRVTVWTDMADGDWNVRKWSEYLPPRQAQDLAENTPIPTTELKRARAGSIEPYEVGDRYPISNRRANTDIENIVADSVRALGQAIGDRWERDLINAANSSFIGGSYGSSTAELTTDHMIDAQFEFGVKNGARNLGIFHQVYHPYAVKPVMKSLVKWDEAGVNLALRERAISEWTLPTLGGRSDIATSEFIKRNVAWRIKVDGTGGTFRLEIAGQTTGAITVSATPATMATNIQTALNALTGLGTFVVAVGGLGTNLDIDVTSPATLFVDADQELKVAINPSSPTAEGFKPSYDLVTGTTGALGTDLAGEDRGVAIEERDAYARNLGFYRPALALDIRQFPRAFFETTNQGRTAEYSLYSVQGIDYYRPTLGAFILSKAVSAQAIA